jgi:hypothetical protein
MKVRHAASQCAFAQAEMLAADPRGKKPSSTALR